MQYTNQAASFLTEINSNKNHVIKIVEQPKSYNTRSRRGLINMVGRVANVLFGVCDDTDAKYFHDKIKELERSKSQLFQITETQTQIMKSILTNVNSSLIELEKKQGSLVDGYNHLLHKTDVIEMDVGILKFQNALTERIALLNVILTQYAYETENLVSIVNSALLGHIHPSLLDASEFNQQLKQIKIQLPIGLGLPIDLAEKGISELLRIVEISVVYVKGILMFIMEIPLIDNYDFMLYKSIPLPVKVRINALRSTGIKTTLQLKAMFDTMKLKTRKDKRSDRVNRYMHQPNSTITERENEVLVDLLTNKRYMDEVWKTITESYNQLQTSGIKTIEELKILIIRITHKTGGGQSKMKSSTISNKIIGMMGNRFESVIKNHSYTPVSTDDQYIGIFDENSPLEFSYLGPYDTNSVTEAITSQPKPHTFYEVENDQQHTSYENITSEKQLIPKLIETSMPQKKLPKVSKAREPRKKLFENINDLTNHLLSSYSTKESFINDNNNLKRKHADIKLHIHPSQLSEFNKCGKKRNIIDDDPAAYKQLKIDEVGKISKKLNETEFDKANIELIVSTVSPFSLIEHPGFIKYCRLTSNRVPASRRNFMRDIVSEYNDMTASLKDELSQVNFVCITADCWSVFHRSYMGFTIHWLNQTTLERTSKGLACRRMYGKHTYDKIAEMIDKVLSEFNIQSKTSLIVTDNAANFVKAFRVYNENTTIQPSTASNHNQDEGEEEEEVMRPINISDELENGVGNLFNLTLPQHQRCAAHTLNLIATTDIGDAEKNKAYKILSRRVFGKCQALFNKQNQSTQYADQIKNVLGRYLITPNATRWNSFYDAIKCIVSNLNKIDEVFSITSLQPFSRPRETLFLIEYCKVMQPIAKSLDILQGDKHVSLEYLLPTLTAINKSLKSLSSLNYCTPLINALQKGIEKRFQRYMSSSTCQISSALIPKFKLNWASSEEKISIKEKLVETLKTCAEDTDSTYTSSQPLVQNDLSHQNLTEDDDFLLFEDDLQESQNNYDLQKIVSDYLLNHNIKSPEDLPITLKKAYIEYNTAVPLSAHVERLFSAGGQKLESVHRRSQLRAACCYSTVSHEAAAVVSGIPPIRLLAKERTEVFEGKGKSEARLDLIINWQREWENCTNGRWTFRLINDLPRWQSRTFGEATDSCEQCGFQPDDAEHAFFNCDAWENWRRRVCAEVDVEELTPENLTNTMLASSFNWNQISKLMSRIMTAREEAERIRQGQPT
ncbi:hypothetical protein QTP88_000151 [Uroleucon formosanum]